MTRFDGYDDGEDRIPQALWERALENAIRGKRGQRLLTALRDALLAMPTHKIIKGHLCLGAGETYLPDPDDLAFVDMNSDDDTPKPREEPELLVCAIGALVWGRVALEQQPLPAPVIRIEFPGGRFHETTDEGGPIDVRSMSDLRHVDRYLARFMGLGAEPEEDVVLDASMVANFAAHRLKMPNVLALRLQWVNDVEFERLTDEERWLAMLGYANGLIQGQTEREALSTGRMLVKARLAAAAKKTRSTTVDEAGRTQA